VESWPVCISPWKKLIAGWLGAAETSSTAESYDAVRAVRLVSILGGGEEVATARAPPLDHAGQRLPGLGVGRAEETR
jgi:hypothetical protein